MIPPLFIQIFLIYLNIITVFLDCQYYFPVFLDFLIDISEKHDILILRGDYMQYEIGKKIKMYRKKLNLNQKDFANLIGVSNSRVSNWEQGINRPDVDTLSIICDVLKISADDLLDIHLQEPQYTELEKKIISEYRKKPELQQAVNIILGIQQ